LIFVKGQLSLAPGRKSLFSLILPGKKNHRGNSHPPEIPDLNR
jgi:hypothetical protein